MLIDDLREQRDELARQLDRRREWAGRQPSDVNRALLEQDALVEFQRAEIRLLKLTVSHHEQTIIGLRRKTTNGAKLNGRN